MNAARLDALVTHIGYKGKPCPLCYAPVGAAWANEYTQLTFQCLNAACRCQLVRQVVPPITPIQLFEETLRAWNRRG